MRTLSLVEVVPAAGPVPEGEIVATAPMACWQLDRAGIAYRTLEDFVAPAVLLDRTPGYGRRFADWLASLDDWVSARPEAQGLPCGLFRLVGYGLKHHVDPFVLRGWKILPVLEALRPDRVVHLAPTSRPALRWGILDREDLAASLDALLLPGVCASRGIAYCRIDHPVPRGPGPSTLRKVTRDRLAVRVERLRTRLGARAARRRRSDPLTLLASSLGWLQELGDAVGRSGHRLLTIEGDRVLDRWTRQRIAPAPPSGRTIRHGDWQELGRRFLDELEPARWPSEEAGYDVSGCLLRRFERFFREEAPSLAAEIEGWADLLERERVDFVVTAGLPHALGPAAAAAFSRRTIAVQVWHGYSENDTIEHWRLAEWPSNLHVSPTREVERFFEGAFPDAGGRPVEVATARTFTSGYVRRRLGRTFGRGPGRVVYVPTLYSGFYDRINAAEYPDCWYYRLQDAIVRWFARRDDWTLVVKALPVAPGRVPDPIPLLVREIDSPRVQWSQAPLTSVLRTADRVFTDYPSSGTFEARLMGLPTLALYGCGLPMRATAKAYFGKTLVEFQRTEEALAAIDRFLEEDPAGYVIEFADEELGGELLSLLESLAARREERR